MKIATMMKWDETSQDYLDPYFGYRVRVSRQNWVFTAVQILGGRVKAGDAMGDSIDSILIWINQGYTDTPFEARRLEDRAGLPRGVIPSGCASTQV